MPVSPSLGFVSTYAPTQCGLASFTASLMRAVSAEGADCSVVRLVDPADTVTGAIDVSDHLIRGNAASVAHAAEVLNGHDVVVIQHEFGIYGGRDGDEVLALINKLTVPVIVVAHTVLTTPSEHQRMIMDELL